MKRTNDRAWFVRNERGVARAEADFAERRRRARIITAFAVFLAIAVVGGCKERDADASKGGANASAAASPDQAAADRVAAMIDALCVQKREDDVEERCRATRDAWNALTDAQKALVAGESADPDYFGRDTGDASRDDPLNADGIGENEILVVSFGTSFNESRVEDIGSVEKAVAAAYPDWSVRRAFSSQIILNHILARDGEKIDSVEEALERAVANGAKRLVVQPTLLMPGAEYDEVVATVERYAERFESVKIGKPLLGRPSGVADVANEDETKALEAVVADAVDVSGFDSLDSVAREGIAFVLLGHGTSHAARVAYAQTQAAAKKLGYDSVWIGTVEGKPESTARDVVMESVATAGFKKITLRPFMMVAGDHAHNDMAGDDPESWRSRFLASGKFESVDVQIRGLGRVDAIRAMLLERLADAMEEREE